MAKPQRYRAYGVRGGIVAEGTMRSSRADVAPRGGDAVKVVFYSGKLNAEVVEASVEVYIPEGTSIQVGMTDERTK